MQLKHLKNVLPAQESPDKIAAITWAPNNLKLAICSSDRVVQLFDDTGEKKDKFPSKPVDAKFGKKSYVITGLAFSPDSTKIAVGQSDNIVFVYKVGEEWGEKKVICNKFPLQSSVSCLAWPSEGPIVIGLADGKVRAGHIRNNRSQTLYTTDSFVVALAVNTRGTGFISGHADGTLMRYYVAEDSHPEPLGRITTHKVPPYALAWPLGFIFAGGCDGKVCIYANDGLLEQTFDYTNEEGGGDEVGDFNVACCSPSGQAVALGSYNRIRVYAWSPDRRTWEEGKGKHIQNLYSVTALSWKQDGSRLTVGGLLGSVDLFETVLRRVIWRNKFEMTYVGPSQVLVRQLEGTGATEGSAAEKGVVLRSQHGYEIKDVKVMGPGDSFIVARTSQTLLVGELKRSLLSEVSWNSRRGNDDVDKEKFYFENPNVCMVFAGGEMSIIEYGQNTILASFRMEFMNPHVISIRINERQVAGVHEYKKLAYLVDLKTICIVDLKTGVSLGQISHDSRIDWLELDETGRRLLFRDHRFCLCLSPVPCHGTSPPTMLLPHCSYVQWVPGSDVVVAQSRTSLCIWYAIDSPERVATVPINGEVIDVIRANGKTEVIVQEGGRQLGYALDEGLVEFGTAVEDGDVNRALAYLEGLDGIGGGTASEAEAMWRALATLALETKQLHVARRCYAAIGDVSAEHFLRETEAIEEEFSKQYGEMAECPEVWARLAIFKKEFKNAELIYLEQNQLEKALNMYKKLNKWEEAYYLASQRGEHDNVHKLKLEWEEWLKEPGREEQAAKLKESEGNSTSALRLYLRAGLPNHAARLLYKSPDLLEDEVIVKDVANALETSSFMEQAGEVWESFGDHKKALELYRRGKAFPRAIELARQKFPKLVVVLEEEWGDHLVESEERPDAALAHYIEAGRNVKALETAVNARQWKKAAQIIQVIDDTNTVMKYYEMIAKHFVSAKDYSVAEELYLKAGLYKDAVEMHIEAGHWEKAERLAREKLDPEKVKEIFVGRAVELEENGRFQEAERMYVAIHEPDQAIAMYKKAKKYDHMMRLVSQYHPDLVASTHTHLGQELEAEGLYTSAEHHYLQTKDWKAAAKMYRAVDMWEEAFRVAKNHGSADAAQMVAYLWASKLGGEAAARLLVRLNLLEPSIDYACENFQFDFAFDLARIAMKEKEAEVHFKCAMVMEDEGKLKEAEEHFIKAGKPREAVLMYMHGHDWENARRIAEQHGGHSSETKAKDGNNTTLLDEVLIAEAGAAFSEGKHQYAESLLLRAGRPDTLLDHYQEAGMWSEALRVCREYIPSKLDMVRAKFEHQDSDPVKVIGQSKAVKSNIRGIQTGGASGLYEKALEWERGGEPSRALQCFLKASDEDADGSIAARALDAAQKLVLKSPPGGQAFAEAARSVGQRLAARGHATGAAQFYLHCELIQEAVEVLVEAKEWTKARRIAAELDPRLEEFVNARHKESLKRGGNVDQLAEVDIVAALDLLAEQGRWGQCLEKAKAHAGIKSNFLHKYIAMYAAELLKEGKVLDALKLYKVNGMPSFPQNYNIYRRMIMGVFALPGLLGSKSYSIWADVRDCLLKLTDSMRKDDEMEAEMKTEFEGYLLASHYSAMHSAFSALDPQKYSTLISKLSVSLLRHTNVVPTDKAFYIAGMDAKAAGKESLAFVLLNHYLDVVEAIEEERENIDERDDSSEPVESWRRSSRPAVLDNTDFEETDIPLDAPLPLNPYLDAATHEEVKEWVLAVSVDQRVEQVLPSDRRGAFEGSLLGPDGVTSLPCVVSGYPLIGLTAMGGPRMSSMIKENEIVEFNREGKYALREDWNKLTVAAKLSGEDASHLRDNIRFISEWCGGVLGAAGGDAGFHF
ncbi:intraflagellar transport protein 172 homolog [Ischnura elegans]|uniref:intraflagellar transport protein 172 homolog n=1 Tax=Ischnura elegans TaxID=197161 RepID=UPI001ED86EB9|nr:intraflagellar transport protein 172 homolog [Ischnura elegans]